MPDRTRPIRKEICLNEQELSVVRHKMNQLGTRNFGAYARKMLIDGYIIKVDYTEQKKLAADVSRAASNINQICRRINSTGRCYEDDVAELKARQAGIREPLKTRQGKILPHCPFVLFVGTKKPVKRREYEPFIREKLGISVASEDLQISGEFFHTMA